MDDTNPIIYGLEFQARALASQQAESNDIRFFIATQSLKPNNQLHAVEVNEDGSYRTKVFAHPFGECWRLTASPHDPRLLASCFSVYENSSIHTKTAILRLPDLSDAAADSHDEFLQFAETEVLATEPHGAEVRAADFHPSDPNLLALVVDGKVLVMSRAEASFQVVAEVAAKGAPRFAGGKWSQWAGGNQFIAIYEGAVRSYDVREPSHVAWSIDEQLVRDVDCNPNKQCHLATGGDDGSVKVWDCRNPREPLFARTDHQHWVFAVRFNTFHDQLLLSAGSDGKVLLTCAGSASSEATAAGVTRGEEGGGPERREQLADGLLQTFEQHEDSVYCAEWSSADPWVFASLSYDGRLMITRVPKQYKYQILM